MRLPVLFCASFFGLTGIAAAQTSLFDQPLSPATPPAALPPGEAVAPAVRPAAPAARAAPPRAAAAPAQPSPAPAASATVQPDPAAPQPAAAKPKPKPKPKPKGPTAARVLTVANDSTGTLSELIVSAGTESVSLAKPVGPGEKAELKLPKLKACNVTVTATFDKAAAQDTSEYDICKGKILHFTD